ncbi:FUSC family protein [Streptomyces sp. NPDC101118]|uniref:FUSC family protein n=1 Tax=Streptomyces sp. NPDC101118 TaxID=3366109 RepID=UPI003818BFA1
MRERLGGRRVPPAYVAAGRRAVRVALVAISGFYLFLYGFGWATAATYALFSSVALAGLSRIPGTGRQRAAVVLRAVPVCWALVVVGTYLSVRTWSAVTGMLVIGFVLAFAAIGGPRLAGAGPGLQLLYILPSFPPYDPGSLGERLIGTTAGLALLVLAEAFLVPEPPPPSYRELAARAAETAARLAREAAGPTGAVPAGEVPAAHRATRALRPLEVPEADRPAGPGVRERGLAHTGLAARTLLTRLLALPAGARAPGDAEVLEAVARLAERTAGLLREPGTDTAEAYGALAAARARLAGAAPGHAPPAVLRRQAAVLEVADAALAMGTAAGLAVRGRAEVPQGAAGRFWYAGLRAPVLWWHRVQGHAGRRSVFFQNAVRLSLALAAARLVAGLDTLPHGFWAMLATLSLTRTTVGDTWSTIRVALAGTFAGALFTAGLLVLGGSHTVVYAVVLPLWMLFAFTVGPVKGVGWAQGLFTVLVAMVFAQLDPATWQLAEFRVLDVLIGSAIGAVFGLLAWPRGAQTELRLAGAGLLRRAAETVVATSASVATGGAPPPADGPATYPSLRHALVLAESAYAQFQSEPVRFGGEAAGAGPAGGAAGARGTGTATAHARSATATGPGDGGSGDGESGGGGSGGSGAGDGRSGDGRSGDGGSESGGTTAGVTTPDGSAADGAAAGRRDDGHGSRRPATDWQAVLMAGHHTLWGADRLALPPAPAAPLGPEAAAALSRLGDRVAGRMLLVSARLDPDGDPAGVPPVPLRDPGFAGFSAEPPDAARPYYATASWLDALMEDLERITAPAGKSAPPEPETS